MADAEPTSKRNCDGLGTDCTCNARLGLQASKPQLTNCRTRHRRATNLQLDYVDIILQCECMVS